MSLRKLLPFLGSILFLTACNHEQEETTYDKKLLIGQWELTDAWRNNKKTETLTGTFYEFESNGHMRTNFTIDMAEGKYQYEFNGREITQKSEPETVYSIDSLTSSTLIFSTTFHNYPFKLALSKKQESEEEPSSDM